MESSLNEKIVSRVQALLAKAESTTYPEEAEALVAKAQELMARYAIGDAVAQQRRASGARPAMRTLKVEAPYARAKISLLTQIGHANVVQVVFNGMFEATLFGFDADLEVVELLFASLLVQATSAMLRVPRENTGGQVKAFRHAFLIAYARRIGERLREARAAAQGEAESDLGVALVPLFEARRAAIDARVHEEFPHLSTQRTSVSHYGGYGAGRAAADRANIGTKGLRGTGRALAR
ncbi:MAG TPA: DUF2786 domain-containing protein [Acidimicrobiales bacterium]|nr:DUF2786 domain-containing protein [Acidimicrobiales bacterium]